MNLKTPLKEVTRILPVQEKALQKLGLVTVADLLYHFPVRYGDTASKMNIGDLRKGDSAVIFGKISNLKTSKAFHKKIPMAEGWRPSSGSSMIMIPGRSSVGKLNSVTNAMKRNVPSEIWCGPSS